MKRHIPVLLDQVLEVLRPRLGEDFVDLTAGYGGHTTDLLRAVGANGHGYLFDRDSEAIKALHDRFKSQNNITIQQANFGSLTTETIPMVDMIFADVGVSSPQIDNPERGFSFTASGPLDMRMDASQDLSAYDIINAYSESEIADILYIYGEERKSRRIAQNIVSARKVHPITTTQQLAEIIVSSTGKSGKIHPATRSFQALRIAVNDELGALQHMLDIAPQRLLPGGRIAIISFHSLEDRLVKQAFKALCTPIRDEYGQIVSKPQFTPVTKKPIQGSEFDKTNPRARSAKLRAVEKIN